MREEDGGRVRQPLIYSGFLLSGGKRRANRLSETQDCPQKQEQVARDVNAQHHTNTFRSHPLDRHYLDFTLVCVLQKNAAATGLHCRTGTTTTDAITIAVVVATAVAAPTTIAIPGQQVQTSTDISSFFYVLSVDSCCALVPGSTKPFVRYLT